MNENTVLLLRLGMDLYELGKQLETRRNRIEQLVAQNGLHDSPDLLQQIQEYNLLKGRFASPEAQFEAANSIRITSPEGGYADDFLALE